ncbi:MAG: ribosome small subunit-dependent GTPase A [Spirochaetaceae bacterium]|nr:ribosome small subunit-dependent GTPase A [Spirochaetaceae bacterium]
MRALVVRGSRNVFTVRGETGGTDTAELECRIKGKILKEMEGYYNPLAPGDRVRIDVDPLQPRRGRILGVEKRRNFLTRFNQKGQRSQILGANLDMMLCVTSPLAPPFRPRFLDRLLVQAEIACIKPVIICNKYDLYLGEDPDTEERLEDFCRIGYEVLRVSAKTGMGMDRLRLLGAGKTSILLGQSGVGKSSLINALNPVLHIKTGALSEKYNRGNHTTTLSQLIELPPFPGVLNPTYIIDTPGIRRMVPDGIKAEELILYMKEFAGLAGLCTYGLSCSHRSEPGCKIMEAVAAGEIHESRYESFLRITDELAVL